MRVLWKEQHHLVSGARGKAPPHVYIAKAGWRETEKSTPLIIEKAR